MEDWYENDIAENEEEDSIKEYDITSTPNDYNIATLFSLIDNGIIKIPPFQRNYVWDIKRASKLIESIILGLPIPQIFLYERGKNNFYVIDGQQRLLSIYFFMKERFPTKDGKDILRDCLTGKDRIEQGILSDDKFFSNFSLKLAGLDGSDNKLNKLKYGTLDQYRHTFEYLRTIRTVVIKQNAPDDDSSMCEIFNRLNTGGQNLLPQEIQMSLFYSGFYDMILDLNKSENWRNLLGQPKLDLHFKDIEILVRGFAMLYWHEQYKSSMSKFLNKFSRHATEFEVEEINYCSKLFDSFLESCSNLKNKSFYTSNNKFNISLFEAVFVAACSEAFKNRTIIQGKILQKDIEYLKKDKDFIEASRESITSKKNINLRIKRAEDIIKLQ